MHAHRQNVTASSYYAFMAHPPTYPPLAVRPFWSGLRRTTAFRGLNLLIDANQRLSFRPIARSHVPYIRAVSRRFGAALFHTLIVELLTFIPYYLIDPSHPRFGIDTYLGSAYWAFTIGATMYQGTAMICESFAGLTIALGLYTDEEWPAKWWHNPLASTSLTEFWGKRYHHFMRVRPLHLAMTVCLTAGRIHTLRGPAQVRWRSPIHLHPWRIRPVRAIPRHLLLPQHRIARVVFSDDVLARMRTRLCDGEGVLQGDGEEGRGVVGQDLDVCVVLAG
jgi:hypothetical protein